MHILYARTYLSCMHVCIYVKYVYIPHAYMSTIALTEKQLLYTYIYGRASPNSIYHYMLAL